jgi:hypothetical protein
LQRAGFVLFISAIQPPPHPVECRDSTKGRCVTRFVILLALLLPGAAVSGAAMAQSKPVKGTTRDACAPIGKLADGQLVYGLSCNTMPASPPRASVEAAPAAAPEPEVERSGIFGMSYTRRPTQ